MEYPKTRIMNESKPLHVREREEWEPFAQRIRNLFREASEEAKKLKMQKNVSKGTQLRNHLNHINKNILE
jgi:hypothetical protein